ncbi:MAG: hypothetical protein QOE79_2144 [Sphingomonadales bacterium]|jgi:hypothetical protein|nr:hypothetical protein [Sphingomonadales bacterium]MEA3050824.1 hypothetical protein [Sphingomonadales bacterium]
MKLLSRLGHPLALVAQGFVVGVLAFVAANPHLLDSRTRVSPDAAALERSLNR